MMCTDVMLAPSSSLCCCFMIYWIGSLMTLLHSLKAQCIKEAPTCNSHVFLNGLTVRWHSFTSYTNHVFTSCSSFGEEVRKQHGASPQWFFTLILLSLLFSQLQHIHMYTLMQERAWSADSIDQMYYGRVNNRRLEWSRIRDEKQWMLLVPLAMMVPLE